MPSAYYLKYRPQSLDHLIGQENVKRVLLSAFQNRKLSHAYLFVGPRGTGKTSTARILAKMVNCEKQQLSVLSGRLSDKEFASSQLTGQQTTDKLNSENRKQKTDNQAIPCNKCSACLSITDGSNLDLIEIDAASNRGIEDIRALKETIKLSPSGKGKKVYIIDEVHMLTQEAFNALLKTLEEPPAHALFILATTDVNKIPATILSRAQRLDFSLATVGELQKVLEKIIGKEKIDIDEEAMNMIIRKSDGSFRDAVKLLDQFGSSGEKITAEKLLSSLKLSKFDELVSLLKDFSKHNVSESLLKIDKYLNGGVEIKELILSLMGLMRDLMLIKSGLGTQMVEPKYTKDKYGLLIELAKDFDIKGLTRQLNVLQEALAKLKFASILSLPLELAVVEICTSTSVIPSEARDLSTGSITLTTGQLKTDLQSSEDSSLIVRSDKIKKADVRSENLIKEVRDLKMEKSEEDQTSSIQHLTSSDDILKLKEKWDFVLETIRPTNFSLEALLRSVNLAQCNEGSVVIEVPYAFHQRILEAPKNRDLLESILSDILGRQIKVVTVLGVRPSRIEDIANVEIAADDEIIRVAAEIFNSEPIN